MSSVHFYFILTASNWNVHSVDGKKKMPFFRVCVFRWNKIDNSNEKLRDRLLSSILLSNENHFRYINISMHRRDICKNSFIRFILWTIHLYSTRELYGSRNFMSQKRYFFFSRVDWIALEPYCVSVPLRSSESPTHIFVHAEFGAIRLLFFFLEKKKQTVKIMDIIFLVFV